MVDYTGINLTEALWLSGRLDEGLAVLDRVLAGPDAIQVLATSLDLDGLCRQAEALSAAAAPAVGEPQPEPGDGEADDDLGAPDGIERFDDAWARRVEVEDFPVCHIDDIIARKEATGRL